MGVASHVPRVCLFLLAALSLVFSSSKSSSEPSLRVRGHVKVVFDWSRQRCAPSNIPDAAARAFRDASGRVQVILAHMENRRLVGRDFNHLRPDCRVVMTSDLDGDPAAYNDREWLASLYTVDGKNIVALVHNEYQGHRHPRRCPSNSYQKCWYNSLTLALSHDGGRSYVQLPGPAKLVASLPTRYVPDTGPSGIFSPSNIVRNPRDGYYYALMRVIDPNSSVRGTCVMRTGKLFQSNSWSAWDGSAFSLKFVNPYAHDAAETSTQICTPVAHEQISEMTDSLTYNTYLDRFLLVGVSGRYNPKQQKTIWGIYYSLSDDLIHWTDRRLLIQSALPWIFSCGDRDPVAYPSVVEPNSASRSFDSSGQRPYLYFTLFHFASCESTPDRDLVRVQIALSK